jgi:hypothetical protein
MLTESNTKYLHSVHIEFQNVSPKSHRIHLLTLTDIPNKFIQQKVEVAGSTL